MSIRIGLARARRTLLMASLFLKFSHLKQRGTAALAVCNAELKLVDDLDSLKLPDALKDVVWKDDARTREVEQYLAQGDIDKACQIIWKWTPRWLRYGDETLRDMEMTLRHVLRSYHTFK